jgi:hypothetical protein
MELLFNPQAIKFEVGAGSLGIDMAAYNSVEQKW